MREFKFACLESIFAARFYKIVLICLFTKNPCLLFAALPGKKKKRDKYLKSFLQHLVKILKSPLSDVKHVSENKVRTVRPVTKILVIKTISETIFYCATCQSPCGKSQDLCAVVKLSQEKFRERAVAKKKTEIGSLNCLRA